MFGTNSQQGVFFVGGSPQSRTGDFRWETKRIVPTNKANRAATSRVNRAASRANAAKASKAAVKVKVKAARAKVKASKDNKASRIRVSVKAARIRAAANPAWTNSAEP